MLRPPCQPLAIAAMFAIVALGGSAHEAHAAKDRAANADGPVAVTALAPSIQGRAAGGTEGTVHGAQTAAASDDADPANAKPGAATSKTDAASEPPDTSSDDNTTTGASHASSSTSSSANEPYQISGINSAELPTI